MNILFPVLGYFLGSIPSALWVTRVAKGVDVREAGSGHVTTTNTIRQAGWLPGVIVFLMDFAKGFLPVYLAGRYGAPVWSLILTAGLVVVGHCWPVFAQFRGGMGLATSAGALFALTPLTFPVALGILLSLLFTLKHSARAALLTGLLAPIAFWALELGEQVVAVGFAVGAVIALRFTIDWNRQYRELWLDREKSGR